MRGKSGVHESSLWAFCLNQHAHYTLHEKTYQMERWFMIDFDGNNWYTADWIEIQGSETYKVIRHDKERGYITFYISSKKLPIKLKINIIYIIIIHKKKIY